MKISIDHAPTNTYYIDATLSMKEFDIPEAQVNWISEVFDNYHKAQTYLKGIYHRGPGTKDF